MTVSKRKHLSEVLIIGGDWFWPFYLSTFETFASDNTPLCGARIKLAKYITILIIVKKHFFKILSLIAVVKKVN